jgi:hypothetical protein
MKNWLVKKEVKKEELDDDKKDKSVKREKVDDNEKPTKKSKK